MQSSKIANFTGSIKGYEKAKHFDSLFIKNIVNFLLLSKSFLIQLINHYWNSISATLKQFETP